jgi:Na+-transporting NADH:ubiquinone oxidoreductase subunit C
MNRQGIIYTIIITFVVSFFFVSLLALTNEFTRTRIERNELITKRRGILNSFGLETTGTDDDYSLYASRIKEKTLGTNQVFEAQLDGEKAEAIQFSGSGLWGTITGVLAVKEDFSRIVGMDIIDHNETPGLGGRIAEAWFKEQFRNEILKEGQIRISGTGGGDKDKDNGKVDAVTGATRTSQALEKILNEYLKIFSEIRGVD